MSGTFQKVKMFSAVLVLVLNYSINNVFHKINEVILSIFLAILYTLLIKYMYYILDWFLLSHVYDGSFVQFLFDLNYNVW